MFAMIRGISTKILFVFGILCLPMAGHCLEVCQLFIHEPGSKVEAFADSIFESAFRLGRQIVTLGDDADPNFLSRRFSLDEKRLLREKGYTLSPRKITFDLLGLVALQEDNDFALRKHQDQFDIFFTFQEQGRKINGFSFKKINQLPTCKELLTQSTKFRQFRPFVVRALNERTREDSSLGKEIMYWESLEAFKIGLSIPDHNLSHSIQGYNRLKEELRQKLESTPRGADFRYFDDQEDSLHLESEERLEIERHLLLAQLNDLRVHILRNGLTNYGAGRASMANYFGGEPANCVANTSVIFSLYLDLGIPLPTNYQFGVQVFTDHLQPVLYDQRNGQVINLLTNEISTEPKGQIINKTGYQKLLILKAKNQLFFEDPLSATLLDESDYIFGFEERSTAYTFLDLENLEEKAVKSPIAANLLRTRIDAFAYNFVGAIETSNLNAPFSSNMLGLISRDYTYVENNDSLGDSNNSPIMHSGLLTEELVERVSDFLLPSEVEDFKRLSRGEPTAEPLENYLSYSLYQRFNASHPKDLFNSILIPLEFIPQEEVEEYYDYDLPDSSFQFLPKLIHKNSRPGRNQGTYIVVYSPEDQHLFKNQPILDQYENLIGRAKSHLDSLGRTSIKVKEALIKSSTIKELILSDEEFGSYLDDILPWFNNWKNNQQNFREYNNAIKNLTGCSSIPEFMAENGFPLITLRHQLVGAYNQFYESSRSRLKTTITEMDQLPDEKLKKFAQRLKLITEFVFSIDDLYWHHQKQTHYFSPSDREIKIFIPLNQMLFEFFVRNKSYYFTTEASEEEKLRFSQLGLDELAEANNTNSLTSSSQELNLPEVNLPDYPGGEEICRDQSGIIILSGSFAIECPSIEQSRTESAFIDPRRKTVILKPQTIAAVISLTNWHDIIKTPNLLMLHYSLRETVLPFLHQSDFGDWGPDNFQYTGSQKIIILFSALIDLMQNTLSGQSKSEIESYLGISTSTQNSAVVNHAVLQAVGQEAPSVFSQSEMDQLREDFDVNLSAFSQMKTLHEQGKGLLIEDNPQLRPAYNFAKQVVLGGATIPTIIVDSGELFSRDRRLYISSQFMPNQLEQLQNYGESVDRMFDSRRSLTNPEKIEFDLSHQAYFYNHMERGSYWDIEFVFAHYRSFYYKNTFYQSDSVLFAFENYIESLEELLNAFISGNLIHIRLPDRNLITKKYETYRYYWNLGLEGNIDFLSAEEHENNLL